MSFKLPELEYSYDAIEPHIDSKTMEIHHSKHHAGYTNNLNTAIKNTSFEGKNIEEILNSLDINNFALRNNGGGYFNHNLFWTIIGPNGGGKPQGKLKAAIDNSFGSFEEFKKIFSNSAATRFGSGWAWLCVHANEELKVCSTANQDNPLMPQIGCGGRPILCIDVWEHAYYLNYQNRRADYISAFFQVVNWDKVEKLYGNVS